MTKFDYLPDNPIALPTISPAIQMGVDHIVSVGSWNGHEDALVIRSCEPAFIEFRFAPEILPMLSMLYDEIRIHFQDEATTEVWTPTIDSRCSTKSRVLAWALDQACERLRHVKRLASAGNVSTLLRGSIVRQT
jgi:hypothetical protein